MARYSDSASPDEAVLIETDDFALVYDRRNRAFHKKLWDSSTKSWTTKVAPYSVIVCKDGSTVWAEDSDGKTIASGESGVDDASVIQSALNLGGTIYITKGEFILNEPVKPNNYTRVILASGAIIKAIEDYETVSGVEYMIDLWNRQYIIIYGGIFDGNGQSLVLLRLGATNKYIIVRDAEFRNAPSQFTLALYNHNVDPGEFITIENCYFHDCGELMIGNPYKNIIVANCYFESITPRLAGRGISINPYKTGKWDEDITVRDCRVIGQGIFTGGEVNGLYLINNVVLNPSGDGLTVQFSKNVMWIGNRIENAGDLGFADHENENSIIIGNKVYNAVNACIKIYNAANSIVYGNILDKNQNSDVDVLTISVGDSGQSKAIIIGNVIKNSARYGIGDHNTIATENIIAYNRFENNSAGALGGGNIANDKIFSNIGYITENSGTATFSGDGATTQFSIAHGLVSTPTKVSVTPMTADAASDFYVTVDDTNIYINYKSAPPSGTDNLKFSWYAEV